MSQTNLTSEEIASRAEALYRQNLRDKVESDERNVGKIILIDNSKQKLGDEGAEFFGRLFIALVLAAAVTAEAVLGEQGLDLRVEPLLERWLSHPALQRRPPRNVPLSAFSDEFAAQAVEQARQMQGGLHDVLCTATHFVASCVGQALTHYLPERPARVLLSAKPAYLVI